MKKNDFKKVLDQHNAQFQANSLVAENTRARSITIGTAFGGTLEAGMRMVNGTYVWCILQPSEVIELIHQMAATIGCHICITPRNDFASWRNWNEDKPSITNFPPFSNHPPHAAIENHTFGMQTQNLTEARSNSNEQVVAAKKTVGRKRTKRTPTPA